jgi:hypothetical protein
MKGRQQALKSKRPGMERRLLSPYIMQITGMYSVYPVVRGKQNKKAKKIFYF